MIRFTQAERRWIEVIFYLLCKRIYENTKKISDIKDFITGYRWTNMFDYDTLINTIEKHNILFNTNFIPSKHELLNILQDPNIRLKIKPQALNPLLWYHASFRITRKTLFRAKMKEEVLPSPTDYYPHLPRGIHETIYSFLLAVRYIADIVKQIKF